jgi:hypothetical protein
MPASVETSTMTISSAEIADAPCLKLATPAS